MRSRTHLFSFNLIKNLLETPNCLNFLFIPEKSFLKKINTDHKFFIFTISVGAGGAEAWENL